MGASNLKHESRADMQIEFLNSDLKRLIFETKGLISADNATNMDLFSKYHHLRKLIEDDIRLIEEFLNANYDISLSAFCINEKVNRLIHTLFAEEIALEATKYNFFKNENKNVYKYEEKLMNFIKNYSNDGCYFNEIFNSKQRNFFAKKKVIFTGNLNENNFLADEIIFSIAPILSDDSNKLQSIKNKIASYSHNLTPEEKAFLHSEALNSFISESFYSSENKMNNFLKFIFMILNHDMNLYVFSGDYSKELEFFEFLSKNNFIKTIIKIRKLIFIFPFKEPSFHVFRSWKEKELINLIIGLNIQVYYIDFDNCYDDKIIFLAKLILKNDPRAYFIPQMLKDKIQGVLVQQINEAYEKLCEDYEKIRKKEKAEAEKLIAELQKAEEVDKSNKNSSGKNKQSNKNIYNNLVKNKEKLAENLNKKFFNEKLIEIINKRYNEEPTKLISKYEFKELFIENLDLKFNERSNIENFEKKLYEVLKNELIDKQNILQTQLIFKCCLYNCLIKDEEFSFYNNIQDKRTDIINSIDAFNFEIQAEIENFVSVYNANIASHLNFLNNNSALNSREEISTPYYTACLSNQLHNPSTGANKFVENSIAFANNNAINNEDSKDINNNNLTYSPYFPTNQDASSSGNKPDFFLRYQTSFWDIFKSEEFCEDYRKLVLLEKEFYKFENSNVAIVNSLSNSIQLKSANSMRNIFHQYFDLSKIFYINNSLNSNYISHQRFDSIKSFPTINMENCRSTLDKVIIQKLNAFNLIHMILFNHYGLKNLKVRKPVSYHRIAVFSGISISFIFALIGLVGKIKKTNRLICGIVSGITMGLGMLFGNYLKNNFVEDSQKYFSANKFILSKYLWVQSNENSSLSATLMKYFKKISEESLELINSLVLIE